MSKKFIRNLIFSIALISIFQVNAYADNETEDFFDSKMETTILNSSDLEKIKPESHLEENVSENVKKEEVEKKETGGIEDKIVNIAKSKLGSPYAFGSRNGYSFDCSGFTSYVFNQAGINIGRTAADQAYGGKTIKREELKKGDLVFFNTFGGISHVGIYIENGDFIHSSSYGNGVVISNLNDNYYKPRFVKCATYLR